MVVSNIIFNAGEQMIVSGRVDFDKGGRLVKQYYPISEQKGADTEFTHSFDTIQPTDMAYDGLDRNTRITIPDNTSTLLSYDVVSFDGKTSLKTRVQDANLVVKETYKNARQLITSVRDVSAPLFGQSIMTRYAYNPVNEMVTVTDNLNNITTIKYDTLGRRTSIDNPDTGKVTTEYDNASNIAKKYTPNLAQASQFIGYNYDEINRLVNVDYPTTGDVSYVYGLPTEAGDLAGNVAGRIKTTTYEKGSKAFEYDKLGNVKKETDTIQSLSGLPNITHVTEYTWDNFARLQDMTYPGDENTGKKLVYGYDAGGLINKARDMVGNDPIATYLHRVLYDKFGKKVLEQAGNGTADIFTYWPETLRVKYIKTVAMASYPAIDGVMQELFYVYDNIGDVTIIQNTAPLNIDGIDYKLDRNFAYDGFNRLSTSTGLLKDRNLDISGLWNVKRHYTTIMGYNSIHNITSKQQDVWDVPDPVTGADVTDPAKTYHFGYNYGTTRPHAPSSIDNGFNSTTRNISYDLNGNQTGFSVTDASGTLARTTTWDEDNQVKSVYDAVNGAMQLSESYAYDEKGERRIKKEQLPTENPPTGNEQVETRYVNQFASRMDTVGGGEMFTKHVFVGNDRIASVLTSPTDPQITFFYHKDHLGSTTYMTDGSGTIKEHIEYTPWGEMWYDVKNTDPVFRPDYYYTGKELDRTGLYYYGARYYDPQTSVWQSTDPALEEYIDSYVGGGGIYNSLNLSTYNYAQQNPIKYVDPDGRLVILAAPAVVAVLAVVGVVAVYQGLKQVREGGGSGLDFQDIVDSSPLLKTIQVFAKANENNNVQPPEQGKNAEEKKSSEDKTVPAAPNNPDNSGDKNNKENKNNDNKNQKPQKDDSKVPKPKDFNNPSKSPGEGWKWKGGEKGQWHNKETGQSLRPDFKNPAHDKHWDYIGPEGKARVFENGKIQWKK